MKNQKIDSNFIAIKPSIFLIYGFLYSLLEYGALYFFKPIDHNLDYIIYFIYVLFLFILFVLFYMNHDINFMYNNIISKVGVYWAKKNFYWVFVIASTILLDRYDFFWQSIIPFCAIPVVMFVFGSWVKSSTLYAKELDISVN